MGEWSNLTQREKSNIIRFAIKNGVSDINQIRDTFNIYISGNGGGNEYKEGGSIHIKHPGRLTALKERTGKTEAELWATGNAHTRKMITLARNARKWKHADGGSLSGFSEYELERINEERRYIENQKQWLQNWYAKRLPAIGKEHLQEYVDAGLGVPYKTTLESPTPSSPSVGANYHFSNNDYRNPSTIKEKGYDTGTGIYFYTYRPIGMLGFKQEKYSTPVHEFTHATQYGGSSIFNPEFTGGKNIGEFDDYLQRPDEQHARIMELRYENKLDPTKTDYTAEDIKNLKDPSGALQELRSGGMDDDAIINALNTWASNTESAFDLGNDKHISSTGGPLYPFSFGPLPAVRYAEGGKKTEGSVWHKEANGLYLDTDANNRTYNDALDYFTQLGFKGKNASDLALQYAADNMQYDAGTLPEITITPNVQKRIIIDNGTKNVHYASHIAPVQESTESKIAAGMIGIPLIATQTAPVLGAAMSKAIAARDAFRLAHPYVSALNDITWTNLGLHDLATDNGIAKTKRLIDEGKKGRALLSGLGDAANALGAFELFRVGSKIANPIYRSAWAYNTIPNWGYKKHLERADNWVSGLLSGTSPNINNEAEWLTTELRKDLIENGTDQFGYLSALFAKNKNAGIEIAARGRDDASRLYNGLPLRHNYYIQNADGSYSYNLAKIEDDWKKLSGEDYFPLRYNDFYPESLATSGHHGKDVITGGGGNLTGNAFIGRVTVGNFPNKEEFAVKLIEDIQDVHPFRRNKNTFSKVLQNIIDKKIQKVQKKADSLYISILNKGQDYGQSKIGKLWYDWIRGEVLNKIRYSGQFRLPGTYYDKSTNDIAVNDFWKTVNAKMRNFELGTLTGAKPFLMRTEVPTTFKHKSTTLNRGRDAKSLEDASNSIVLEPTLILGHHSDKYVIPVVVNSSSRFNIDYSNHINPNFSFNDYLKSTGGPLYLYPFSFKKNPYWKTPVVRYKNGGKVNRDSEFLQSETIKNVKKWLNKGTKFQTPRPRTVFTQNIVDALDPSGPDNQYVWDNAEHTSYSAFRRNPDYRAPAIPAINKGISPIGLNVSRYIEKAPGVHLSPEYILNNLPNFKIPPVSVSLPKRNDQNLKGNWIQTGASWNPAYGYETFHLENSNPDLYGIKYYSIPGAINSGQGSSAVLDSTIMGMPIQELNNRIFDYRIKNGGWNSFSDIN